MTARNSDFMTAIRRRIGPLIANRTTGRLVGTVLRNRIPHRGLTINTDDAIVRPETKAALFVRGYESSEYRFVKKYLPTHCDVIELGGSLGVISCIIRRHIDPARQLVIVEADPRLANLLRSNLAANACEQNTTLVEAAIAYDAGDTILFAQGETSVSGRLADDTQSLPTLEVRALSLSTLVDRFGLTDFALVCDIEGAEWQIIERDLAVMARARVIILETHGDEPRHDDLVGKLIGAGRYALLDQHGSVIVLARA